MARSDSDICNGALSLLKATRIVNLETDQTENARLCNVFYTSSRDALTRMEPWNCSMAREQIAKLTTDPINAYSYQYLWPTDAVVIWSVNEDPEEAELTENFKVEGRVILTDEPTPIKVRYGKEMVNPGEMDALFYKLFQFRLAADLAYSLTGSRTVEADMEVKFDAALKAARHADGREGTPNQMFKTTLINVRN